MTARFAAWFEAPQMKACHPLYEAGKHDFDRSLIQDKAKAALLFVPRSLYSGTPTTIGDMDANQPGIKEYRDAIRILTECYLRMPDNYVKSDVNENKQVPEKLLYIEYVFKPTEEYELLNAYKYAHQTRNMVIAHRRVTLRKNDPSYTRSSAEVVDHASFMLMTDDEKMHMQTLSGQLSHMSDDLRDQKYKVRGRVCMCVCVCSSPLLTSY